MYIIGGTASESIAKDLCKELKAPYLKNISKRFPDGELYIRILEDISKEHVIIIQTTHPDQKIIELFLLQDALKEAGAKKITVVIPYFGYARQDQQFNKGEPISARAIAELISSKADKVITVDPHKEYILDFFTVPAVSCSAVPELAQYLNKKKNIDMVLAPDKGALERAKRAAKIIGCKLDYMKKTRIDGETVRIEPKNLNA